MCQTTIPCMILITYAFDLVKSREMAICLHLIGSVFHLNQLEHTPSTLAPFNVKI